MTTKTPVKVLYQKKYYDAKIRRAWGDGVYEIEYENKEWGKDTVDESRIQFLQEVEVWYEGTLYGAKIKEDLQNGTYDVIYDNPAFGQENVTAKRIRWTKGPPTFAETQAASYEEPTEPVFEEQNLIDTNPSCAKSGATRSVIGQRIQVQYGEECYTAIIKESHVDEMYLVVYDDAKFGEEIIEGSKIVWDLNGVRVQVLFNQKYFVATIRRDLGERGYLVEYEKYGVETVTLDRIRWAEEKKPPPEQVETPSKPVLQKPEVKRHLVGAKVNVWFEGKLYGAEIKSTPSENTYLIAYDERAYGEEIVDAPRVVWPTQQPKIYEEYTSPSKSYSRSYVSSGPNDRSSPLSHPTQADNDSQTCYVQLVETRDAFIEMTKKCQRLEEQISRIHSLPRKYLETMGIEKQQRVFSDLSEILNQKQTCAFCRDQPKTEMLLPCQHGTCFECAKTAVTSKTCQVCRAVVRGVVNLFI